MTPASATQNEEYSPRGTLYISFELSAKKWRLAFGEGTGQIRERFSPAARDRQAP